MQDPHRIEKDGILYALVIPGKLPVDGVRFLTPQESSFQVGLMERPGGYVVRPHMHPPRDVSVRGTPEFLSIVEGRVRAIVYDEAWAVLGEAILGAGDALLLLAGGHSFEVLEPCRILEVKQGPYAGDSSAKVYLPSSDMEKGS